MSCFNEQKIIGTLRLSITENIIFSCNKVLLFKHQKLMENHKNIYL